MKKLALLAGVALLAACGTKEPAPEPAATDAAAMDAAAPAPMATVTAGSYDVTMPDGSKRVTTVMADGTYVDRDEADKVVEKGMIAMKDGKTCFTPEGEAEQCFTESAHAADGSFTATGPDGKVTMVKPHAA